MSVSVLRLDQITRRFGALVASDAISLDLRPGEIHALIGPNGAGKSTLIAQIAGALRPDSGRVWLADRDVTNLGTPARAKLGLGRTFQISALAMEHTVMENVLLGAQAARGCRLSLWRSVARDPDLCAVAEAALARVGLSGQNSTQTAALSHGQRRQLEVAVALTLAPRLFLMDEPMAGLGLEGTAAMTRLLDGLRREAPILLVEHDMDAVFALADRISVLVAGQIIASGPPDAIRADAAVRAAYLGEDDI